MTEIKKYIIEINNLLNTNEKLIKHLPWIVAALIAFLSTLIRYFWFVFQRGRTVYLKIDSVGISTANTQTIYELFLQFIVGAITVLIAIVPLFLWKIVSKKTNAVIFIIIHMIIICGSFVYYFYKMSNDKNIKTFIFASIVLYLFLSVLPSLVFGIIIQPQKGKENNNLKKVIINITVFITAYIVGLSFFFYGMGYCSEKNRNSYRITNENYAIIYENETQYYLAKCNSDVNPINSIDFNQQLIVNKEDVEYVWQKR